MKHADSGGRIQKRRASTQNPRSYAPTCVQKSSCVRSITDLCKVGLSENGQIIPTLLPEENHA